MAGAKFQYDESGGTFFYFLLSFEALVVIPCTYYFWPREVGKQEPKRDKSQCHCDNCRIKNSRLRSKEPWRKAKERFIKFLLIIGWTALFLTFYKVAHLQHDYLPYDPFEILQIDQASSMPEIKKAYRRLSLVYHPDKETGDEKKFMMIAKAYAALTDDEARKNWEMYGNPDGPGATSFGIALPSWIVEKENSFWVLGLYALVFMVALPVAVGMWWYRSVKYNGDQILLETSHMFFYYIHKTPYMIQRRVIMILGAASEFEKGKGDVVERPSDNIEVPQLIKEITNLGAKNRETPLCFPYSLKARALIYAHLYRMKLPPFSLEPDKLQVVKKCPYLIQEFVNNASQLTVLAINGKLKRIPHLDTIEHAMKLCQMIVQALSENKSPLFQLPHINEDILRHFTTRKRNIRNIQNLASMKSDDRRAMLRSLNDDEYEDVMNVMAKMPLVDLSVKSEVLDDEDSCTITAGAIVTVTATLLRKNMSSLFNQEVSQQNGYVEEHDDEGNPPVPNGDVPSKTKKNKVWEKQKKKKSKNKPKKKGPGGGGGGKAISTVKKTIEERNGNAVQIDAGGDAQNVEKEKKKEIESKDSNSEDSETESFSTHSGDVEEKPLLKLINEPVSSDDDDEWEKFQQKIFKKEKVLETKSKKSHTVHCPFFPEEKEEYWWVYLADKKKHALISIPYLVTNLVDREEIELKFTAPPKPGLYTYSVIVRSDSYVDFDVTKLIKFDVKEAKEDLSKYVWDVSEEEEEKDEEESVVEDSDLATDDDDESDSD